MLEYLSGFSFSEVHVDLYQLIKLNLLPVISEKDHLF